MPIHIMDIKLPCGGGLEILIIPTPDEIEITKTLDRLARRSAAVIAVDKSSGKITSYDRSHPIPRAQELQVLVEPQPKFFVFGKGPEAIAFSSLVRSLGYPQLLLSPDNETLSVSDAAGCDVRHLSKNENLSDLSLDRNCAVVLFFHDHDWEPGILDFALTTEAFYIGAQGSKKTQHDRKTALSQLGLESEEINRVHGPIGMIPSARDSRILAVSVLAEILNEV